MIRGCLGFILWCFLGNNIGFFIALAVLFFLGVLEGKPPFGPSQRGEAVIAIILGAVGGYYLAWKMLGALTQKK